MPWSPMFLWRELVTSEEKKHPIRMVVAQCIIAQIRAYILSEMGFEMKVEVNGNALCFRWVKGVGEARIFWRI